MSIKWLGAAAWSAKEAHAGDRLPYARLVDEQTVLLRDGSLMSTLQVPGLLFPPPDGGIVTVVYPIMFSPDPEGQ